MPRGSAAREGASEHRAGDGVVRTARPYDTAPHRLPATAPLLVQPPDTARSPARRPGPVPSRHMDLFIGIAAGSLTLGAVLTASVARALRMRDRP